MKIKQKIIAILIISFLITIQISSIGASNTSFNEQQNNFVKAELITIGPDGNFSIIKLLLSNETIIELKETIQTIIETVQTTEDLENISEIINNIPINNEIIKNIFFKALPGSKLFRNRALVISSGHGYKLNPLKKFNFRFQKKMAMWYYSSNSAMEDITVILKPFSLKSKTLNGNQLGFMTKFKGIYLSIPDLSQGRSYMFFMGMARHINGIDL